MRSQPTQVSELAKRAAEAGTGRNTAIEYRLVQGGDLLAALQAMNATAPLRAAVGDTNDARMPICNLTAFRAAGLGAVSCTWASAIQVQEFHEVVGEDIVHTGRAVLNPNFLHDSTVHVELMLTLGDPPWRPTIADCLMLTRMCRELLDCTAKVGSVLFLHSPVAPAIDPSRSKRGDGSEETPRDAQGPCLRMLIGIESTDPDARLAFELDVTRLAEQYGLGLLMADRRYDRARGEWFKIRGFDRAAYKRARDVLFRGGAARFPRRGLVLSCVGPARQGTAWTIVEQLVAQDFGLIGMSVSVLQGVAFVNYFLAVDDHPRELALHTAANPIADGWESRLADLKAMWVQGVDSRHSTGLARGYEMRFGPARRCYFPTSSRRTGAGRDARAPYPLWVAWEAPSRSLGAVEVLAAISERIAGGAESHRLTYAQSRLVSPELMRGRAKFSVVLPESKSESLLPAQDMLGKLAGAVEHGIIDWLSRECQLPQARCRVSAKERWLRYARTVR